jgi:NAD(P)-dependent dehydrogenase (short-subunit alcohol dehydrogenase family)
MNDRRIALVTGANKGIGREIASQLAARGIMVWIGARDESRGETAAEALRAQGADARFVRLDVTSDESVREAARIVAAQSPRLDILVNNAGVALDLGVIPSELPLERMKAIYEVNVFGPVRVTQAFLPLIKKATAGRIVMVSSGLGSLTQQANPASSAYQASLRGYNLLGYNTSKAALNAITLVFAKEFAGGPIKINAANPGFTATDLNDHRGTQTAAEGAAIEVELALLGEDGPTGGLFSSNGPEPW